MSFYGSNIPHTPVGGSDASANFTSVIREHRFTNSVWQQSGDSATLGTWTPQGQFIQQIPAHQIEELRYHPQYVAQNPAVTVATYSQPTGYQPSQSSFLPNGQPYQTPQTSAASPLMNGSGTNPRSNSSLNGNVEYMDASPRPAAEYINGAYTSQEGTLVPQPSSTPNSRCSSVQNLDNESVMMAGSKTPTSMSAAYILPIGATVQSSNQGNAMPGYPLQQPPQSQQSLHNSSGYPGQNQKSVQHRYTGEETRIVENIQTGKSSMHSESNIQGQRVDERANVNSRLKTMILNKQQSNNQYQNQGQYYMHQQIQHAVQHQQQEQQQNLEPATSPRIPNEQSQYLSSQQQRSERTRNVEQHFQQHRVLHYQQQHNIKYEQQPDTRMVYQHMSQQNMGAEQQKYQHYHFQQQIAAQYQNVQIKTEPPDPALDSSPKSSFSVAQNVSSNNNKQVSSAERAAQQHITQTDIKIETSNGNFLAKGHHPQNLVTEGGGFRGSEPILSNSQRATMINQHVANSFETSVYSNYVDGRRLDDHSRDNCNVEYSDKCGQNSDEVCRDSCLSQMKKESSESSFIDSGFCPKQFSEEIKLAEKEHRDPKCYQDCTKLASIECGYSQQFTETWDELSVGTVEVETTNSEENDQTPGMFRGFDGRGNNFYDNVERLRNNVKTEIPICTCFPCDRLPPEPGSYYTHLGAAASLADLRKDLESRVGYKGDAIRMEKILYTGKEGKTAQGCPLAKWIIRRSSIEEKLLVVVKNRKGHTCPTAWIVVAIVAWEGVPINEADCVYDMLTDKLTKYGVPTIRRCGTNEPRTCACQGLDQEKCGASFSFGCSWSMYYNGCKFARSKTTRKFRLSVKSEEQEVEQRLNELATIIAPVYKAVAPESFKNMTEFEKDAVECRLGFNPGRPWSGVTACVDFCAHAHRDIHNMHKGCTTVVNLTKYRGLSKPDDEQLHVLPLYIIDNTDEFGSKDGQENKIKQGAIEILNKYPCEVRVRAVPLLPCRRNKKRKEAEDNISGKKNVARTPDRGVQYQKSPTHQKINTNGGIRHSFSVKEISTGSLQSMPDSDHSPHSATQYSENQHPFIMKEMSSAAVCSRPDSNRSLQSENYSVANRGSPGTPERNVYNNKLSSAMYGYPSTPPQRKMSTASSESPSGSEWSTSDSTTSFSPFRGHSPSTMPNQTDAEHVRRFVVPFPSVDEPSCSNSGGSNIINQVKLPSFGDPKSFSDHKGPLPSFTSYRGSFSYFPGLNGLTPWTGTPFISSDAHNRTSEFDQISPNGFREPCWNAYQPQYSYQQWNCSNTTVSSSLTPLDFPEQEKCEPIGEVTDFVDNEECFKDPEVGGVAIALGHGAVLFECAKHELHATTALKKPNRQNPTRISLVFYQHRNLNRPKHGGDEWEEKMRIKKLHNTSTPTSSACISTDFTPVSTNITPIKSPQFALKSSSSSYSTIPWTALFPTHPYVAACPYQPKQISPIH